MIANSGPSPDDTRQKAILYVEGEADSLDSKVLSDLLGIPVEPLKSSRDIRVVAEALHLNHPNYYFLIDRDHSTDDAVTQSWQNFPDPKKKNLLIWRKKELENYFLDPDYLRKSKYLCRNTEALEQTILAEANQRVFMDVANRVIGTISYLIRHQKWMKNFKVSELSNSDQAIQGIIQEINREERLKIISDNISNLEITEKYHELLDKFSGGRVPLEFGHGPWLDLMSGKKILKVVINKHFGITHNGRKLVGDDLLNGVVQNLLNLDLEDQPNDFKELKRMFDNILKSKK